MSNGAKGNIIDFISDAVKSPDLTAAFLAIQDDPRDPTIAPKALNSWLTDLGYSVNIADCQKLIEARNNYNTLSAAAIRSY